MVLRTVVLLARRLPRREKNRRAQQFKWDHPLYGPGKTPPEGRMKGLMKGMYPVTRTRSYLNEGIIFRDCVKIMTINYGTYVDRKTSHEGIEKVVHLNVPQMRYMNPDVQIEVFENMTPTPFVTFFLESGEKFHIDVDGKQQFDILTHIQKVIGKPKQLIKKETAEVSKSPANFGQDYDRKCICMVEGQVPCSSTNLDTPGHAWALKGKSLNLNPKKYLYGKED